MSIYLANKEHLDRGLTMVGDAIRAKTGETNLMEFPDGFVSRINSIPKPNILFDNREYRYGRIPVTLTMNYTANATYVDIVIEYSTPTLPIFTNISYITCKQPWATSSSYYGYVEVSGNNWKCRVAGYSNVIWWENKSPTITILSSTNTKLSLRLSGVTTAQTSSMSRSVGFTYPYDYAYISVVGE